MEHFLLCCSFNVIIRDLLSSKLRVPLLHGQTYGQLAFGFFSEYSASVLIRKDRLLPSIFFETLTVLNAAVLYYLRQTCCLACFQAQDDSPETLVWPICTVIQLLVMTEKKLMSSAKWQLAWGLMMSNSFLVLRTMCLRCGGFGCFLFVSIYCPFCNFWL